MISRRSAGNARTGRGLLEEKHYACKTVAGGDIRVFGEFEDRCKQAYSNLLDFNNRAKRPDAYSLLWKKTAEYVWGADFQGQWLEVMSTLAEHMGKLSPAVDKLAEWMLAEQFPDGSFSHKSNYHTQFGNHRAIIGLLEYYKVSKEQRFLAAAKRLGDWYYKKFLDKSKHPKRLLFSTCVPVALGGLVALSQITAEKKYYDISRSLADIVIWQSRDLNTRYHTAGFLPCTRGLLDLYLATGEGLYLKSVLKIWKAFTDRGLWLSGGIPEFYLSADEQADEACSVADWISLNLSLWRLTGQAKYMDFVERSLLNHVYFNQLPNGGFSGTCNIEQGFRVSESWFCCSMHVPRAFGDVRSMIYTHNKGNIWVNLFFDSRVKILLDNKKQVVIRQKTEYPKKGKINLAVSCQNPTSFALRLRVPNWADGKAIGLRVNGKKGKFIIENSYLVIKKTWRRSEKIEVDIPLKMRVETSVLGQHRNKGCPVKLRNKVIPAKRIGVFCGPVLLTVFRTDHNNDLSWVYRSGYNEVLDSGGMYRKADRSCSDYIRLNDYSFAADSKPSVTEIIVKPESVELKWSYSLKRLAKLEYVVRVSAGLPVKLKYEQTLSVRASKGKPVALKQLLLSGLRLAVRKEQLHDKYGWSFKYLYPVAPRVSADGKEFVLPRNNMAVKKTGKYRLDNILFRADCKYQGQIERIKILKNKDWVGVYLSPISKRCVLTQSETYVISKTVTFPVEAYRKRKWLGENKSVDSAVTQFQGQSNVV